MGRTPEQPPAPQDPNPDDDRVWREFIAEIFGPNANPDDFAAEAKDITGRETLLRKRELRNRIIDVSDVLVAAPKEFPDRKVLEHILAASARLVDPVPNIRRLQLNTAIQNIAEALAMLRREAAELDDSDIA